MARTLVLLLFLAIPLTAQGADLKILFEEANTHLYEGRFSEAVKSYEILRSDYGVESPSIYYNLGVTYLRKGELGQAIWAFERTLLRGPSDQLEADARANLNIVRTRLKEAHRKSGARSQVVFEQAPGMWTSLRELLPRRDLYGLTFILGLFAAMLWIGTRRNLWNGRLSRALGILSLCLFAALTALCVGEANSQATFRRGVVVHANGVLREASHESAPSLNTAPGEGITVRIVDGTHPDFVRVELPNGADGWIKRTTIEEI